MSSTYTVPSPIADGGQLFQFPPFSLFAVPRTSFHPTSVDIVPERLSIKSYVTSESQLVGEKVHVVSGAPLLESFHGRLLVIVKAADVCPFTVAVMEISPFVPLQ